MHRCLYVLDILKVLFDFVIEDEKPGSGTNTIVALVYACRTFQDTGLDILWRGIHSLFPLIKCLPTDAWELNAIRRGDLVLVRLSYYICRARLSLLNCGLLDTQTSNGSFRLGS